MWTWHETLQIPAIGDQYEILFENEFPAAKVSTVGTCITAVDVVM